MQNNNTTTKPQNKVLFSLGQIFLTIGAKEALEEAEQNAFDFLSRHQTGDFGLVCKDDWKENEVSIKEGFRILSSYKTNLGEKIWIISEADRSSSCVLLPEEY